MRTTLPRLFLVCSAVVAIVIIFCVSLYTLTARASIYNLYASMCLGGWENTHLASGVPEANELGGAPIFTQVNSARLDASAHAQIYCGGFAGDILENTVPKNILVKFSWAVEYPKLNTEVLQVEDTAATTDSAAQIEGNIQIKNEDANATGAFDQSAEKSNAELGPAAAESGESETLAPTESVSEPESEAVSAVEESTPQPQETTSEPSPEPAPQEPSASILNFFATVVYAQEILDTVSSTTDAIEETATTTPDIATPTSISAYGLVEVLYTLDGVEWKSLGFVEKDEFGSKYFEIPIEEVSDWENIAKIQIGIQSVPVVDGVAPIIYLDSVWIETEYEYTNQSDTSQLANVASAIGEVLGETIGELIPTEEQEALEEVIVDELPIEETYQPIIEPVPLPPRLSVRNFTKEIIIDPNAVHRCEASPFSIDVFGRRSFSTKVMLQKSLDENYQLEIGSLPDGVNMVFSANDDYVYEPDFDDDIVSLRIRNEEGALTGNFTVPIVFTQKGKEDSSVICQINIVNVK